MSTAEIPAATHTTPAEPLEAALRWACVLSAVLVSIPGWVTLSTIWGRTEYLAHGYMIPVVAAYLCHRDRESILSKLRSGSPPPLGFLLVFAAMTLEALALLGDVMVLTGLGIPILFAATAYALGGRPLLRTTRLPIAFLVLMVPPPGVLVTPVLFELKLLVTRISVGLLQAIGQPVAALGNQIIVPNGTLFVADACSGLTSIVTLLPLSVILAYFLCRGIWRRAGVVLSILPLAISANVLRVLITVELVSLRGIESAQGFLHESFGVSTFVLGSLCLVAVARLLR